MTDPVTLEASSRMLPIASLALQVFCANLRNLLKNLEANIRYVMVAETPRWMDAREAESAISKWARR